MKTVATIAAVCLCSACLCLAAELGDPAPPLQIQEWVKGEPVTIEPGMSNIVVVEFWATWCAPCRDSIPHLSELQERFGGQGVRFVGISSEPPKTVQPFVDDMSNKMDYTVAVDLSNATSKAYMGAYGVQGIPHAFVVDTNATIVWHTHPMSGLDDVVSGVLAGTFDPAKAERREAVARAVNAFGYLVGQGRDPESSRVLGTFLLSELNDNADMLLQLSDAVMQQSAEASADGYDIACRAALRAAELTGRTNPLALHAAGRALWSLGKTNAALESMRAAAKLPAAGETVAQITNEIARMEADTFDLAGDAAETEAATMLLGTYFYLAAESGSDIDLLDMIADRILEHGRNDADLLAAFAAQVFIGPEMEYRDLDRASTAAQRAFELTSGSNALACEAHAYALYHAGKPEAAITQLDNAIALSSDEEELSRLQTSRRGIADGTFGRNLTDDTKKARALSRVYAFLATSFDEPELLDPLALRVIALGSQDATLLNEFAWNILSEPQLKYRDLESARLAAQRAVELGHAQNPGIIDTYAKALFMLGDLQAAVSNERIAVELAVDGDDQDEMRETLAEYEAAAEKPAAEEPPADKPAE